MKCSVQFPPVLYLLQCPCTSPWKPVLEVWVPVEIIVVQVELLHAGGHLFFIDVHFGMWCVATDTEINAIYSL